MMRLRSVAFVLCGLLLAHCGAESDRMEPGGPPATPPAGPTSLADAARPVTSDLPTGGAGAARVEQPAPPPNAESVYEDGLLGQWRNWSWEVTLKEQSDIAMGRTALQVAFGLGDSGFKLAHSQAGVPIPIDARAYSHVVFHLHPGSAPSPNLSAMQFRLENGSTPVPVAKYATLMADNWTRVRIPLAEANDRQASFSFLELVHAEGATVNVDAIWLEPAPGHVAEASTRNLTVDGRPRSFLLVRPGTQSAPLPIVIVLHADGQSTIAMRADFGIEHQAGDQAVVAYLDSERDSFDYNTRAGREAEAHFVRALVDALVNEAIGRRDRVFLAGHSGGATMTNALGCMLGTNVVRAVGISAGTLWSVGGDFTIDPSGVAQCALPPSVIVWGTADPSPYTSYAKGVLTRDQYRITFGCFPAEPPKTAVSPAPCVSYGVCTKPLTWCAIEGMGHALWPRASEAMWAFFASQL